MKLTEYRPHGFGHLGVHVKNQITYQISSFEQDVLKNLFKNGIPNTIRRVRSKFLVIAIPAFMYYQIYDWGKRSQNVLDRKNPKDYENDV